MERQRIFQPSYLEKEGGKLFSLSLQATCITSLVSRLIPTEDIQHCHAQISLQHIRSNILGLKYVNCSSIQELKLNIHLFALLHLPPQIPPLQFLAKGTKTLRDTYENSPASLMISRALCCYILSAVTYCCHNSNTGQTWNLMKLNSLFTE